MNRIRELREEKNLRAEDLANRIGITVRYLYDLEKGSRRLNEDLINRLCDILEVEAGYLLGRSPFRKLSLDASNIESIELRKGYKSDDITPERMEEIGKQILNLEKALANLKKSLSNDVENK